MQLLVQMIISCQIWSCYFERKEIGMKLMLEDILKSSIIYHQVEKTLSIYKKVGYPFLVEIDVHED
jgi:hypothetical protein